MPKRPAAMTRPGIQRGPTLGQALAVVAAAGLLLAPPAHAYVDPGTGSFVLQLLLALFFGIAFTVRRFWRGLLRSLGKSAGEDERSDRDAPVDPR